MFLSKHKVLCEIWNNFAWQTIWDLFKTSSSKKSTAHMKKYENQENFAFNPNISRFEAIIVILKLFQSFSVLNQAHGALRDLKWCERCLLITESPKTPGHYRYLIWVELIFLDQKSETCQKNSIFKKSTTHMKEHENSESLIFNPYISNFKMIVVTFWHYLEFSCFGSRTRCSARSEINFSWQ